VVNDVGETPLDPARAGTDVSKVLARERVRSLIFGGEPASTSIDRFTVLECLGTGGMGSGVRGVRSAPGSEDRARAAARGQPDQPGDAAATTSASFAELATDPYDDEIPELDPEDPSVCGVVTDGETRYALVSYDSYADALDAGAHVTHTGRCGLCSPLQDLAVYMREPDLTDLVRQCGLDFIMGPIRAVPSV